MPPDVETPVPIPSPIPAPVQAAIESPLDAISPPIQALPDAIAAPVQAIRQSWLAAISGAIRPPVQVPVDACPAAIQAPVDAIAPAIQAVLDAISLSSGVRGGVVECGVGFGQGRVRFRARGAQQVQAGQGCRVENGLMPLHGMLLFSSHPLRRRAGFESPTPGRASGCEKNPGGSVLEFSGRSGQPWGKPGREGRLR